MQVLSLWLWLSYRSRQESFPGQALTRDMAGRLIELMEEGLQVGLCDA